MGAAATGAILCLILLVPLSDPAHVLRSVRYLLAERVSPFETFLISATELGVAFSALLFFRVALRARRPEWRRLAVYGPIVPVVLVFMVVGSVLTNLLLGITASIMSTTDPVWILRDESEVTFKAVVAAALLALSLWYAAPRVSRLPVALSLPALVAVGLMQAFLSIWQVAYRGVDMGLEVAIYVLLGPIALAAATAVIASVVAFERAVRVNGSDGAATRVDGAHTS